jgi:hypothetical protein
MGKRKQWNLPVEVNHRLSLEIGLLSVSWPLGGEADPKNARYRLIKAYSAANKSSPLPPVDSEMSFFYQS